MATGTMHRINSAIFPTKSCILSSYYCHIISILRLLLPYYLHITKSLRLFSPHITPILCPYCAHIGPLRPSYDCSFAQTTNPTSDERLLLPKSAVNSHWFHAVTHMVFCVCDTKRIKSRYILAKASSFSHCASFGFSVLKLLQICGCPVGLQSFWFEPCQSEFRGFLRWAVKSMVGQRLRAKKSLPPSNSILERSTPAGSCVRKTGRN